MVLAYLDQGDEHNVAHCPFDPAACTATDIENACACAFRQFWQTLNHTVTGQESKGMFSEGPKASANAQRSFPTITRPRLTENLR